jgi:hypothetical protein
VAASVPLFPVVSIDSGPTDPSTSASAGFAFTSDDGAGPGITDTDCDLDGGGFAPCDSGTSQTYAGPLSAGSHTFTVRVTDGASNQASDAYTWTINASPTTTTITSDGPDPSAAGDVVAVSWTVTASGPGTVTGIVTVTDASNSVDCSAPVATGHCSLALTVAGTYNLKATYSGNFPGGFGSAAHTVTEGALHHLVLGPSSATKAAGVDQAYTAEGYDKFDNDLGDVTSATTFSISSGTCAANSCWSTRAGPRKVTGRSGTARGTATLTVTALAAHHLLFDHQPRNAKTNTAITPGVSVQIVDLYGNLVVSSATVTLTLGANPGGATLGGTLSVAASVGVASFNDLTLNKKSSGYTLQATCPTILGGTSNRFAITLF